MTDLAAWLLEQIDADEQATRANWNKDGVTDERWWGTPFQPSRVLAECEAKRRIVETYVAPGQSPHPGTPCDNEDDPYDGCSLHSRSWDDKHHSEWVLRLLALPYADRPGCRPEWLPNGGDR